MRPLNLLLVLTAALAATGSTSGKRDLRCNPTATAVMPSCCLAGRQLTQLSAVEAVAQASTVATGSSAVATADATAFTAISLPAIPLPLPVTELVPTQHIVPMPTSPAPSVLAPSSSAPVMLTPNSPAPLPTTAQSGCPDGQESVVLLLSPPITSQPAYCLLPNAASPKKQM